MQGRQGLEDTVWAGQGVRRDDRGDGIQSSWRPWWDEAL